jgi:predicted dehydrogenase
MIRAAIVGIGRWGQTLVGAVQGQSGAFRFTAGHTRTRAKAEAFCA